MKVLIVGGAGYIGSHAVRAISAAGLAPVVLDNLSEGFRAAVPEEVPFVEASLAESGRVREAIRAHEIEAVMHFAAYISVEESVREPEKYWKNNLGGLEALLGAMRQEHVTNIVFSSTAAVYGTQDKMPLGEDTPPAPNNPYGETKLACEKALAQAAAEWGLNWAALRYFNACGAHPSGEIGEAHRDETHLVPNCLGVALGRADSFKIFGDDYPTPDGTCVRDFLNVVDLVEAHVAALGPLSEGALNQPINLGTGKGNSVLEILSACREVTGHAIPCEVAPRRAGDAVELVAAVEAAARLLGWQSRIVDVRKSIETAWRWHTSHPEGYA